MKPQDIKAKRIDTPADQVRLVIAGRSSYFNCLEATLDDDDKQDGPKSYKSAVLVPKNAPVEAISVLIQGVKDAIEIGIRKKWNGSKPAKLQLPINNGDEKAKESAEKYDAYAGCWNFTAKRREKDGRPRLKAHGKEVTESGIIESGDWCVWDITLYPFANKKNGVAVALNGVTLIMEGERFSGGPSKDSIDDAANGLYGEMLGSGLPEDAADDLLSSLMNGQKQAADKDELMSLLG